MANAEIQPVWCGLTVLGQPSGMGSIDNTFSSIWEKTTVPREILKTKDGVDSPASLKATTAKVYPAPEMSPPHA